MSENTRDAGDIVTYRAQSKRTPTVCLSRRTSQMTGQSRLGQQDDDQPESKANDDLQTEPQLFLLHTGPGNCDDQNSRRRSSQHRLVRGRRHVGKLLMLRGAVNSNTKHRSPRNRRLAIHAGLRDFAGLLDIPLGHDHGDVSNVNRRPSSPQWTGRTPHHLARWRQAYSCDIPRSRLLHMHRQWS